MNILQWCEEDNSEMVPYFFILSIYVAKLKKTVKTKKYLSHFLAFQNFKIIQCNESLGRAFTTIVGQPYVSFL